jgi:hypothetical protein
MKKKSMMRKKNKKGPTPLTCRDELFCRLFFGVLFLTSERRFSISLHKGFLKQSFLFSFQRLAA